MIFSHMERDYSDLTSSKNGAATMKEDAAAASKLKGPGWCHFYCKFFLFLFQNTGKLCTPKLDNCFAIVTAY